MYNSDIFEKSTLGLLSFLSATSSFEIFPNFVGLFNYDASSKINSISKSSSFLGLSPSFGSSSYLGLILFLGSS